jgi:hypothetical protein
MSNASGHSAAFNAGIVIDAQRRWQCNTCGRLHVTQASTEGVQTPLHQCAALAGTWVPFVPAGSGAVIRVEERQDYIGKDTVFHDTNGRPIMSVYTMREDGEDCHILAPTTNMTFES